MIVGIVRSVTVRHHIVDPLRVDIVTDAFAIGGQLDLVGIVIVFQKSADQVSASDTA